MRPGRAIDVLGGLIVHMEDMIAQDREGWDARAGITSHVGGLPRVRVCGGIRGGALSGRSRESAIDVLASQGDADATVD